MGTVVQIGPTADTEVEVGDIVAYVKNAVKFIQHPNTKEEIYLLNDDDLLVIINKETADV